MAVVKRIGVWSLVKVYTIIMAIVGLAAALAQAVMFFALQKFNPAAVQGVDVGTIYWGILSIPVQLIIFGFVGSALMAWLYNKLAPALGGVEVDLLLEKKQR